MKPGHKRVLFFSHPVQNFRDIKSHRFNDVILLEWTYQGGEDGQRI